MSSFSKAIITGLEINQEDSIILDLKLPTPIQFKSGQHISLGTTIKGKEIYRTYSICDPAQPKRKDRIRLGIRILKEGIFSSWLKHCQIGDSLKVSPPSGLFYLHPPRKQDQKNLFIAGGSGITPILSMMEDQLMHYPKTRAILLYNNQTFRRTMFLEKLLQLKNQYLDRLELHFFTSRENQEVAWRNSRLDRKSLKMLTEKKILKLKTIKDIYLCGPVPLMEECQNFFLKNNIPPSSLFSENFTPAKISKENKRKKKFSKKIEKGKKEKTVSLVTVILHGLEQTFEFQETEESLLSSARRQKLPTPYACTGGMCGTCRAKLLKGKVVMEKNYALDKEDLKKSFILTCQSRPQTPEVKISFDF